MDNILLKNIFTEVTSNQSQYKIHFARRGDGHPLDAFMRSDLTASDSEWKSWNSYSSGESKGKLKIPKNEFNRKYIFSLIHFYHEVDTWLFGGIWEVIDRSLTLGNSCPYSIKLCPQYEEFIGRLKIVYPYSDRTTRPKLEKHFKSFIVKEILEQPYDIKNFPGHKNVDIDFKSLALIFKKDNQSWKNALSVKGIYLISDVKSGKKYVGSASGNDGIWGRWRAYVNDGHGGDVDLKKLVNEKGFPYVQDNYKFTILEYFGGWEENEILGRESYWKRVLLSRLETGGHNKN